MEFLPVFFFLVIILMGARSFRLPPKMDFQNEPLIAISAARIFGNQWILFNSRGIVVCRGRKIVAHYPPDALILLKKGVIRVNGVARWELVFEVNGKKVAHSFFPRRAGFDRFYKELKSRQPGIIKGWWNKWLG